MTLPERVQADYEGMNLTTGPHPMKLLREQLPNVWRAIDLAEARHGATVQIAGNVICRQRPGTAKGFVFISLEDETGVANAIVTPDLFERLRLVITEEPFLVIEGKVQNTDNVVLVKAKNIRPLAHVQLAGSAVARFSLGPVSLSMRWWSETLSSRGEDDCPAAIRSPQLDRVSLQRPKGM